MATRTDARGVVTTYEYDDLNRLETVSYNTSGATGVATTSGVTYDYGTSGTDNGLLMSVEVGSLASGGYKLEYDYDVYGRVSEAKQWFSTTQSYTMSYELNEAGQQKELTYPSSRVETYTYDSKGMLSGTSDLDNITYNIGGKLTGWRIGTSQNNITASYSYSAERMQMTNQTVTRTVASVNTTLMDLDYDMEASAGDNGAGSTAGNAGQLMGVSGTIDSQTESAVYTYDNLRRLVTAAQTTSGVSVERGFAYDRWGNRTGVWDELSGGSQIQSVELEESGSVPTNRLDSVETLRVPADYTCDAAGNVTDDDVHTYVYDAENRLVSINSGAEQYKYDPQNRRVAKTVGSVTTHYIWEGNQVIAEHAASTGNVLADYVYAGAGGQMIKKVEGGTTRYILSDRLSARMMLDTSYNVVGKQGHLPFGEEAGTSGQQEKHRFTSYERGSSTGLDYAVNRWHSPVVGRFLQADPYKGSGSASDPQSWNRYSYTKNDPINFSDPLGLFVAAPPIPVSCGPPEVFENFFSELINFAPGTLWVDPEGCGDSVIYLGEGHEKETPWKIAPRDTKLNADFVATARGVVKIPNNCDCKVICSGDADYQIRCDCSWLWNNSLTGDIPKRFPEDYWRTTPSQKWKVWNPRVDSPHTEENIFFDWVYKRNHYTDPIYIDDENDYVFW